MPRKIFHIDLDAFFCSVEENNNPTLRGKPFAVGGRPDQRGVVASCSYAARMQGVHSAMAMSRALTICPELIIVSNRYGDYGKISMQVMNYLKTLTPLVEQVSIDEAFLDLSDIPDNNEMLAKSIQKYIMDHFHLPCSIGVAANKLVAKIATDTGKASKRSVKPPNAILVISPGGEAEFLAPLPTKALWGIGPKTSERLAKLGIHTIGDISRLPVVDHKNSFGKYGNELTKRSLGIDDSLVQTSHIIKSISNEITFSNDISDVQILHETLHNLSESVGHRLRKKNLVGKIIKLKLRWKNFTTLTKQITLSIPTNDDNEIYHSGKDLFSIIWKKGKAIRLLGIGVSQLTEPPGQMSLWETDSQKDGKLLSAVDELKEKYGKNAIIRGSALINIDPINNKTAPMNKT